MQVPTENFKVLGKQKNIIFTAIIFSKTTSTKISSYLSLFARKKIKRQEFTSLIEKSGWHNGKIKIKQKCIHVFILVCIQVKDLNCTSSITNKFTLGTDKK